MTRLTHLGFWLADRFARIAPALLALFCIATIIGLFTLVLIALFTGCPGLVG